MPGASDHRPHFGNFGLDPELCEDKEHGLLGSHPLPPHRHPPPPEVKNRSTEWSVWKRCPCAKELTLARLLSWLLWGEPRPHHTTLVS